MAGRWLGASGRTCTTMKMAAGRSAGSAPTSAMSGCTAPLDPPMTMRSCVMGWALQTLCGATARCMRCGRVRTELAVPPARAPDDVNRAFHLVAIAASAGGLAALATILKDLPSDFSLPIALVQHVDPEHKSRVADILG